MPNPLGDIMAPPVLSIASALLDDMERLRIANENRLRQLVRRGMDEEGEWGLNLLPAEIVLVEGDNVVQRILDAAKVHVQMQEESLKKRIMKPKYWHPFVWEMALMLPPMIESNARATKNLQRTMEEHPLSSWIAGQKGLGLKQVGRLFAVIGDPYWNNLHDRPRLVSELWSYSGYGVTSKGLAPARARGVKSNWSDTARMRMRMISESTMKSGGPYREVYDEAKEKYTTSVHEQKCVRCGPSGSPAEPGSPLSKNHAHGRALRIVSKTILRDMWRQARAVHAAHGEPVEDTAA